MYEERIASFEMQNTNLTTGLGTEETESEYESLPEECGLGTYMLAGAAAGIMEHCVMYPLDSVKVSIFLFSIIPNL